MGKLVDIVIPIYNRAHCIDGLIQQLQNQTMQDFCAIFVDDGSTDDSYAVLQKSLEAAPFSYQLIRRENGGAAAARNTALHVSAGKWIAFVDSDDSMNPRYLEYLVRAVTESHADLGVCRYQMVLEDQDVPVCADAPFDYIEMSPADCMRMYCTQWLGVYCLLISGELVRKKGLYFDEACIYCEDAPYIADVIEAASKVAYVDQSLYLYHTYAGSLSRSPELHKFLSGVESFRRMEASFARRDSEAAKVFQQMGSARYYIAVCRKAAVQLSYQDFSALADVVDYHQYRGKLSTLRRSQRIAAKVLLLSRSVFYYGIRCLFRD